jgi:hypothetical protein
MSPDHQRTRELPATAEAPAATTDVAPPVRFWKQRVPSRIGRARTSTVVLGVLFLALFGLYLGVRPAAVEYTTVETTSGQTVRVPVSELSPTPEPTEPAEPTSVVPEPGTPSGTPSGTTAPPATTAPRSTPSEPEEDEGTTTQAPTTTRAPAPTTDPGTEQSPATSAEPEDPAEEPAEPSPTG